MGSNLCPRTPSETWCLFTPHFSFMLFFQSRRLQNAVSHLTNLPSVLMLLSDEVTETCSQQSSTFVNKLGHLMAELSYKVTTTTFSWYTRWPHGVDLGSVFRIWQAQWWNLIRNLKKTKPVIVNPWSAKIWPDFSDQNVSPFYGELGNVEYMLPSAGHYRKSSLHLSFSWCSVTKVKRRSYL